jgi:hypothetical protein
MVGNNAENFGAMADGLSIDAERQETCVADYEQTAASWQAVLDPYVNDGATDVEIATSYEPSENRAEAALLLKEAMVLERAAENILRQFSLPNPIIMRAKECEEANAFYDPASREIIFCYELVDHFYELAINYPPTAGTGD